MRLGVVLGALASHWRRRPLQLAAALAGLAIATALWSGVQALNAEARRSYAKAAAVLDADATPRLEPAAGTTVDPALHVALRRAGWAVSPVLEGRLRIGGDSVRVIGVEPLTLPGGTLAGAFADGPGLVAFAQPPWAMLGAPETLARIGAAPGAPAAGPAGPLPEGFASDRLAPGVLVMDIGAAEAALARPGAITALLLDPAAVPPPTPWEAVAGDRLRHAPPGGESDLDRLTASFHLNLTAFAVLAFAVGLFIAHAAAGLAFEQRRGTIRTLRATGAAARTVAAALGLELLAGALLAGLLGLGLGAAIAHALMPDVAATLRGLYGAAIGDGLGLAPGWWAAGLAMSLGGAAVAGGHTVARVWRMPVLASAGREAWRTAEARGLRLQGAAAAAVLAGAGALGLAGEGLVAGFGTMAGVLVGATLLLPVALLGLLAVADRVARGPVAEWLVADARQQLPGLGLALMALLLALAANVGVGTMVGSFRTAFVDWLDKRLIADLYHDAGGEAAAAVDAWLMTRPEVAAVLPTRRAEAELGGFPVAVIGRPDAPAYRQGWPLLDALPGAWDRVATGEGLMLSEQLARRLGVGLGDRVALPAPGGAWEAEVVARFADYGNPVGQVSVGLSAMAARWPGAAHDGSSILMAAGAAPGPLAAALADRFGLGPDRLIDNAALKAFSLRVFERTFAVTAMLNVLTLGVAGVALFASLLTLGDLRLTQLAPLWALGLTRRRLALLDLARTAALALLTAAVALPLGLAVAWLLVAVINVEAFGWRLPMRLFPAEWLKLAAMTLLVSIAAGALPALRLARTPPARLLKLFAEER